MNEDKVLELEVSERLPLEQLAVDIAVHLRRRPILTRHVAGVVEVDDLLEALQRAVVHVRLREAVAWPGVDVADRRHPVLAVVLIRHGGPFPRR